MDREGSDGQRRSAFARPGAEGDKERYGVMPLEVEEMKHYLRINVGVSWGNS